MFVDSLSRLTKESVLHEIEREGEGGRDKERERKGERKREKKREKEGEKDRERKGERVK